jgi:hypothetical protein
MNRVGAIVALAGLVAGAQGQVTAVYTEASLDGGQTWSNAVNAAPGSTVYVRTRVALEGATALGLVGTNFQPTLSGWRASLGDTRLGFQFPGINVQPGFVGQPLTETSYQGSNVFDAPGATGRIFPYGGSGMGFASAGGLLTSFNDPGNVLRFAGSKNTTASTNPAWGVTITQTPPGWIGTYFNTSLDVVVFKYAVTLSADPTARTLVAEVPLANFSLPRASWYTDASGLNPLYAPVVASSLHPANIFVPAPGGVVMGVLGAVVAARRRRGP